MKTSRILPIVALVLSLASLALSIAQTIQLRARLADETQRSDTIQEFLTGEGRERSQLAQRIEKGGGK